MCIEEKLKEMGYPLPEVSKTVGLFIPARIVGSVMFTSGSTALVNGKLPKEGLVGADVSLEDAQECARIALLNCLAKAKAALGDLNRIKTIIKLNGFVASDPGFYQQSQVMNAASEFLVELFGESGRHARTALGVAALPGNSPIEIEFIAEITD